MKRLAAVAAILLAAHCGSVNRYNDVVEIRRLIAGGAELQQKAWQMRDAGFLTVDLEERSKLQQMMDETVEVEELSVTPVTIDVNGDHAIAVSNQKLVRKVGAETVVTESTITQLFRRDAKGFWRVQS